MAWIPPISLTESLKDISKKFKTKEGRKNLKETASILAISVPIGVTLGMGALWTVGRVNYGTWDYKKWPDIKKEMHTEYKDINEVNKNKDNTLDISEFIYR